MTSLAQLPPSVASSAGKHSVTSQEAAVAVEEDRQLPQVLLFDTGLVSKG